MYTNYKDIILNHNELRNAVLLYSPVTTCRACYRYLKLYLHYLGIAIQS